MFPLTYSALSFDDAAKSSSCEVVGTVPSHNSQLPQLTVWELCRWIGGREGRKQITQCEL